MNILLTGASGFIGMHISKALNSSGHKVKEVTRGNGYDFNKMTTKESWLPLLQDIDIVINCVGIISETYNQKFKTLHYQAPRALFYACTEVGTQRVIQISALGADEQAFTPYQISKKNADDVLRSLSLNWFVLRPSLVYGRGGKSMKVFQRLACLPVLPLIDGGKQMIQPVHISDLTDTVLNCLTSAETNITLDIVGAHAVSFKEWLQLMRIEKGKSRAFIISIPFKISMIIARLSQFIIPLISPDNLRMLQKGNIANAKPLADYIGRMPLDLKTGWGKL
jgi:uncharacterized protein YbjT (DUF2867 family)